MCQSIEMTILKCDMWSGASGAWTVIVHIKLFLWTCMVDSLKKNYIKTCLMLPNVKRSSSMKQKLACGLSWRAPHDRFFKKLLNHLQTTLLRLDNNQSFCDNYNFAKRYSFFPKPADLFLLLKPAWRRKGTSFSISVEYN